MRILCRKVALSLRVVSCLLLAVLLLTAIPAQAARPVIPRYELAVNLDYEGAFLSVQETVAYTNNTGVSLDTLVFNVNPAYFESFTLKEALVNERPVVPKLDGVVLDVPLPSSLAPGQAASVILRFTVNVPERGGRYGVSEDIMTLGNWFPILAVYRSEASKAAGTEPGWDRHQNPGFGDAFFTEVADFQVTVNASSAVEIAHTGTLVSREGNRWIMEAGRVRDFAMAVSPRYQTSSLEVDGIRIVAYYLPEHAKGGAQYLDNAARMVQWMDRRVGRYPYPQLTIAEMATENTGEAGQEYPTLSLIGTGYTKYPGQIDGILASLILHELAHHWFYGVVGNDQLQEPWLDEGLVTWLALQFFRENYPRLFTIIWKDRIVNRLQRADSKVEPPIDGPIDTFSDEDQYLLVTYRKGAAFLEELYQSMGDGPFFTALNRYVATFQDGVAVSADFLDVMQEDTAVNLYPLYAKYFSDPRLRRGEPLRSPASVPLTDPWQESVSIGLAAPGAAVAAYVDGQQVGTVQGDSTLTLDTRRWDNGEHTLVLIAQDEQGVLGRKAHRFTVLNRPRPAAPGPSGVQAAVDARTFTISSLFQDATSMESNSVKLAALVTLLGGVAGVLVVRRRVQRRGGTTK